MKRTSKQKILFVPEAGGQALGKGLLLFNQSCGSFCILIIGDEFGRCCEVVGVFHGLLERVLVELDDLFAHARGSNDAAGGAEPLVIEALFAQSRDVGVLRQTLFCEDSQNLDVGAAGDVSGLYDAPVSLAAEQGDELIVGVALGQVGVLEAGGVGESLSFLTGTL